MSKVYHAVKQIPLFPSTKVCTKCKQEKPLDAFGRNKKSGPEGLHSHCRVCRAQYAREHKKPRPPRYRPGYYQKHRTHVLSYQQNWQRRRRGRGIYPVLLAKQNGVCAICGQPEVNKNQYGKKALAVDHDHKTNKVRGLLCQACNSGLGMFKDDPTRLAKAIEYLQNAEDLTEVINSYRSVDTPIANVPD